MQHLRPFVLLMALLAATATVPTAATATAPPRTPSAAQPIEDFFISSLRQRTYGEGEFKVEQTLQVTQAFTRSLISYTSDGLTVYGMMNTPKGPGPFPVVLVLHGYVNPRAYRTPYTYTQRYADTLARQGFLVIHPDYRAHGRSEGFETTGNYFRVGYAIDVLNLIEFVKRMPNAKPNAIGLFGHSMGGGIAQRVLVVNTKDVKAAVLYGAMNADEILNVKQITTVFRPGAHTQEQDVPAELWGQISPVGYLGDIAAAVQIHHGQKDNQVPPDWSRNLNARLGELGKRVELFEYPGQGHSLQGRSLTTMMDRVVVFFRETLTGL